jgi:hypothetical protein
VEHLSAYLENVEFQPQPPSVSANAYQEAAAVLATIDDPMLLRSTSHETGDAEKVLAPDLVVAPTRRALGISKMLRYDVRREALSRLGSREAILRALEANPQERTGKIQRRFEECVRGEVKPLAEQPLEDLEATLQAVLWLDHLQLPGVPKVTDVRLALARARFVEPFNRIAGAHFHGRKKELDTLRDFVGVIEPETFSARVVSTVSRILNLKRKPALNVYGPGGIGKSALVMRFFLEHFNLPADRRVPFAYLDFDSSFLNIGDLSTLAAEMFRQLRLQFPELPEAPTQLMPGDVAEQLAGLLGRLSQHAQQPFLLVLDTFEEVQYGGEARAYPLWDMLNALQARWPFLRVLISGRVPVKSLVLDSTAPVQLELSGLDDEAAAAVLASSGISSSEFASALVKQVGRVPLSLRLAADVVRREGASSKGVKDLSTSSYVFFSVGDEVIQGQLYERILGHLHSRELEKLAHPGLVLRRLTADLILKVLKEPCALSISTPDEAQALYDKLARETALVSEEADQSLHHRSDVRRTMLRLLLNREPKKAEEIRRRAVKYYTGREEPGALAEELYHRLMLGELPRDREKDLRRPDVRLSLSRSMSELPCKSQLLLAVFGYDIPPEIQRQASKEQREAATAAKIRELLPHGPSATAAADDLLKSAFYRGSDSPLYLEEARIRFLQQRYDDVFSLTDEGLRYAFETQDQPRVLDLLALKTWALEEAGRTQELALALPHLTSTAARLHRPLTEIQALAQTYRLARATENRDAALAALTHLKGLLKGLDSGGFAQIAPVLKDIVAPAADLDPEVLHMIVPLIVTARGALAAAGMIERYLRKRFTEDTKVGAAVERGLGSHDGQFLSDALASLLRAYGDRRKDVFTDVANLMDSVLREWPDRLPYLANVSGASAV